MIIIIIIIISPILAGFGLVPQRTRLKRIENVYIVLRSC